MGKNRGIGCFSLAERAGRDCFGMIASQNAEQSRVKLFSVGLTEEKIKINPEVSKFLHHFMKNSTYIVL